MLWNVSSLKTTLIGSVLSAAVATALTWYLVSDNLNTKHTLVLETIAKEHAVAVQKETDRVLQLERSLLTINNEIERVQHEKQQELDAAQTRIDKLIAVGKLRLRIPTGKTSCPTTADSPSASGNYGGETTELPEQITRDLFNLTRDADQVVVQLQGCQQYIKDITGAINASQSNP